MNPSNTLRRALKSAAAAEIQAIAIYEAECFWIRRRGRGEILREVLEEERAHGRFVAEWIRLGPVSVFTNRLAGWILGSALASLPWRTLCRVQSWAEGEAAKIYRDAERSIGGAESIPGDPRLLQGLRDAALSEDRHAELFRRLAEA